MWQQTIRDPAVRPSAARGRRWLLWTPILLVAIALLGALAVPVGGAAAKDSGEHQVSGAGKTIIEGGTGGATPLPVTTVVAFHADTQGGNFECLALAPPQQTGPGSGEFSVNAMYVTGHVTSVEITRQSAVLKGSATVTGIGAGHDQLFTATVTAGGPGATVVLEVSGLTFRETLVDGNINVD